MEQNIQSIENNKLNSSKLNKKIILLIMIVLIVVGAGVAYFLFFNKENNNSLSAENEKEVEIDRELDSDQDGLPDYLEKIIGTNENNSDTDGDTYSDFEEIKNGYNSLDNKKYTEKEWEAVKEKIKNEDDEFFKEMFDVIDNGFVCGNSTVVDIDGNIYKTVEIGNQCWMKENLRVTKDSQGNSIVRYCYNNDDGICNTDGGLYDWNTAMNDSTQEGAQGICPDEWHIPKDSEWYVLEKGFAVDSCHADREGKDCDPAGRDLASGGASGFEGVYAGVRDVLGGFNVRGVIVEFWSSTETGDYVWNRALNEWYSMIIREKGSKDPNFSIRCIKD